jgi:hypothetical protein
MPPMMSWRILISLHASPQVDSVVGKNCTAPHQQIFVREDMS